MAHADCRVVGVFGDMVLVQGCRPTREPVYIHTSGHVALTAFTPDERINEMLKTLSRWVAVAAWKRVEPVDTPFGVVAWAPLDAKLEPVGRSGADKRVMIILVPGDDWVEAARELASIHEALGLQVYVVTWNDVLRLCKPVEPPPGFANTTLVSRLCGRGYNVTRALCLISFERMMLREGLAYLLIVGPASLSPPVYYRSPILEYVVGGCQSLVPTDYWYMDPDYDWTPEVAVGRLPFDHPQLLEEYVSVVRAWLDSRRSSAVFAGGAPFQWLLLMGEVGVEEASQTASRLEDVKLLTLSLGSYQPLAIQGLVGRYSLYYIASHGVGDMLVDVFPGGLWGTSIDAVLAPKLLGQSVNATPGVYVTPACLAAYWDYDVAPPPFLGDSVAVAMLKLGYAVAFYGSTRVAVAAVASVDADPSGRLEVEAVGALRLTSLYTVFLTTSSTLGEALVKALTAYSSMARGLAIAYLPTGSEDVAELTMLEFTLLGDPALPALNVRMVNASLPEPRFKPDYLYPAKAFLSYLSSIASGDMPLVVFNSTQPLVISFNRCPESVKVVALARYYSIVLADLEPLSAYVHRYDNGSCIVVVDPRPGPSLVEVVYSGPWGYRRIFLLWAGLSVERVGPEAFRVTASGLDLLRVIGDEPVALLANGSIVAWLPGGAYSIAISVKPEPGLTVYEVRPWRSYMQLVLSLGDARRAEEILRRVFRVSVLIPPRVTIESVGGDTVVVRVKGGVVERVEGGHIVQHSHDVYVVQVTSPNATMVVVGVGGRVSATLPSIKHAEKHTTGYTRTVIVTNVSTTTVTSTVYASRGGPGLIAAITTGIIAGFTLLAASWSRRKR